MIEVRWLMLLKEAVENRRRLRRLQVGAELGLA